MRFLSSRMTTAAMTAAVVAILAGCVNPLDRLSLGENNGTLTVSVTNAINVRTLLPQVSMNVASFSISGSGPDNASISGSSTGESVSFTKLAFGTWMLTVTAYNDASPAVPIGSGTATVEVHTGTTSEVTVTVTPLTGSGTLSVDVGWTAADIETAAIEASLIPTIGPTRSLEFSLAEGSASFSASDVAAGYHTLTLQLLDGGIVTAGAVEMVRIVKDAVTSGSFSFARVNKPGGTIEVNIDPELADPIEVTMSGLTTSISEGQTMTVEASVPAETPNVSYVWYLNGASVSTGSPYTFGNTLPRGYYRLDLTAITADGTRAGSATGSFEVTPGVLPSAQALWARTVSAGSSSSVFNGVAVNLSSGEVYAAGYQSGTGTYTYGPGASATGTAGTNIALVKYTAAGSSQWAQTVSSGTISSVFSGIALDATGNLYAAGGQTGTGSYTYGSGVSANGSSGTTNVVLVKYGPTGAAQWARTVSTGTSVSLFSGVAVDTSGNIYAAGSQAGTETYTYGPNVTATGTFGNYNALLVKYGPSGAAQWARTVSSGTSTSRFFGVATDSAGGVYAVGYQWGSGSYTYGTGVSVSGSSGATNVVLVKYNPSGVALWARSVSSGTMGSQFSGVAVDPSGNVYAVGSQDGTGTYTYAPGVSATGSSANINVLLVKYSPSGAAQWARSVSTGTIDSEFNGVAVDSSGNVYAGGNQYGSEAYTYGSGVSASGTADHYNVVLVKYDTSGSAMWARTLSGGSAGDAEFRGAAVDATGNSYAAGYQYGTTTFTYGTGVSATGSSSSHNVALVKYSP